MAALSVAGVVMEAVQGLTTPKAVATSTTSELEARQLQESANTQRVTILVAGFVLLAGFGLTALLLSK